MAYIEPNSELRLLAGINIDQDYNHTLFFNSREKQAAFFKSRTVKTFDKLSYQRKERGYIRVNCVPEEVYGCNYMMYKNTNFDPQNLERWIYCFVESIEYINNNCAEIRYTVDRMQTWMFDYKLGDCLVDREHTLTDNIDEYLTPEPISPFELTIDNAEATKTRKSFSEFAATVVLKTKIVGCYDVSELLDPITLNWTAYRQIGTSGGDCFIYTCLGINEPISSQYYLSSFNGNPIAPVTYQNPTLSVFLKGFVDSKYFTDRKGGTEIGSEKSTIADIVDIFIYPLDAFEKAYIRMLDDIPQYSSKSVLLDRPSKFTYNSTGYAPRNAKLLSSPYTHLNISTLNGDSCQARYELFTGKTENKFAIYCHQNIIGPGVCVLSPRDYLNTAFYSMNSVSIESPLMVYYQNSNVADYIRNNKIGMIAAGVKTGVSILGGALTLGVASAGAGELASAAADISSKASAYRPTKRIAKHLTREAGQIEREAGQQFVDTTQEALKTGASDLVSYAIGALQARVNANKMFGGTTDGNTEATFGRQGYYCYATIPVLESAQQIDDYFDRFGYKLLTTHRPYVDEAKTNDRPVSDLRGVWNYIKTVDCVVHHSNPDSAAIGYSAQDEAIIASIYNKGITFWFDNEKIGDYNTYRNANSIFNPQPGPTPPPTPQFDDNVLSGIDISRFQSSCDPYNPDRVYGVMNVEDLMSQVGGPQFCIIRAGGSDGGDGTIFNDPVFEDGTLSNGQPFNGYATQLANAIISRPQIKCAIYWATGASTVEEMQNECAHLIQLIQRNRLYPDMGVFLDLELPRTLNTGAANCDAIYRAFVESMEFYGYTPWLYTFRSAFQNNFLSNDYRNGRFHVAISAPYNEDINYVGTPPTEAIDDVSSGAYSFIPTTKGAWQYGKSNRWTDYNGAYMDGDYFYWKGVSK